MRTWLLPIRLLIWFLIILAVAATFSFGGLSVQTWFAAIRNIILLMGAEYLLYRGLLLTGKIKPTRWENIVITCLILFLLFDPSLPWFVFPLLGIVAELGQRFIRTITGPLFNPAALSTLVLSLLGYYPGWWGVSFSPRLPIVEGGVSVAMILILPVAGYIAYKYRKLTLVLSALVTFIPLYFFVFQRNPLFLVVEGTLAFFLLVMAVEPKTTPASAKEQYLFGGLLGIFIVIAQYFYALEPYVMSLLGVNALFQIYRYAVRRRWVAPLI